MFSINIFNILMAIWLLPPSGIIRSAYQFGCGSHKLQVHRLLVPGYSVPLPLRRASSLDHIPLDHTDKTFVRICIDKYFQVHQVSVIEGRIKRGSLDDDNITRLDMNGLGQSAAGKIRISRLLDAFQQGGLALRGAANQMRRMVEINILTFLTGNMAAIFVIRILRE